MENGKFSRFCFNQKTFLKLVKELPTDIIDQYTSCGDICF